MRYRRLDPNRDFSFGLGRADYIVDAREAVAQSVLTRLLLMTGEWFLDTTEGTPYNEQILGVNTQRTRDRAIRNRILTTTGVTGIASYSSQVTDRRFRVQASLDTIFGRTPLDVTL